LNDFISESVVIFERKQDVSETKIWKRNDILVKCENTWKREFKNTTL